VGTQTTVVQVGGLHWATSEAVIEKALLRRPGVLAVDANALSQTATVTFDPATTSVAALTGWVEDCGYHCAGQSVPDHVCDPMAEPGTPHDHNHHATTATTDRGAHAHHAAVAAHAGHGPAARSAHEVMGHGGHQGSMDEMVRDMRNRFLVALLFSIPITLFSMIGREFLGFTVPAPFGLRDDVFMLLLSLPVVFWSAWIFFDGAYRALRARTLDMMVLVAVAIGTGWVYSLWVTLTGGGEVFYEAATVLAAFVLLGHWFEMRARGGANDAVRTLLELAPPMAVVLRDGVEVEVPTADVQVGDLLLVRPGAKVPVDAVVVEGESDVDESMVTGESLPVGKAPGADLIGASINVSGTLRARATKVGADTALAQIVALVQEAQNSKAPGQRLADRAAFWLVFVALIGGTVTFLAWWLGGASTSTAMLYAITVVVITCPDALGLATPTAIMVGTGLGAQRGILFKNATALEAAARIDTVVMDKTGTLTKGEPEVTDMVVADDVTEVDVLALVAAVERESEHPLARAVVAHATAKGLTIPPATDFRTVAGHGATAVVSGHRVVVGNRRLMDTEGIELGALARARRDRAHRRTRRRRRPGGGGDRVGGRCPPHRRRGGGGPARPRHHSRDADRGQRGHRAPHRRPTRHRHSHRRGPAWGQGRQDRRAAAGRGPGRDGGRRRQRRPRPGHRGHRNRDRCGHRRRHRDRRRGPHALRPPRRARRLADRQRHVAEDAAEPRLGHRVQHHRATHRGGRVPALPRDLPFPGDRRAVDVRVLGDRGRQRPAVEAPAPAPAGSVRPACSSTGRPTLNPRGSHTQRGPSSSGLRHGVIAATGRLPTLGDTPRVGVPAPGWS